MTKECAVDDCSNKVNGTELCTTHRPKKLCTFDGCITSARSKGLCRKHSGRRQQSGFLMPKVKLGEAPPSLGEIYFLSSDAPEVTVCSQNEPHHPRSRGAVGHVVDVASAYWGAAWGRPVVARSNRHFV